MTMSQEDRARLAELREHVRGELTRGAAEQWLDDAATGADAGPFPGVPHLWQDWHASDPAGFAAYLRGRVGEGRARQDRRAAELEAEAEREAADRRAQAIAAAVVVALVLGVVVVVIVRRRRRARQREAPRPVVTRAPEAPAAPWAGLRLG